MVLVFRIYRSYVFLAEPKNRGVECRNFNLGQNCGNYFAFLYKIRLGWERGGGAGVCAYSIKKVLQYKFESCEHLFWISFCLLVLSNSFYNIRNTKKYQHYIFIYIYINKSIEGVNTRTSHQYTTNYLYKYFRKYLVFHIFKGVGKFI